MDSITAEARARLTLLVAGQGEGRLVGQAVGRFGSAEKAIAAPGLRSRLRQGLNADTERCVEREIHSLRSVGGRFVHPEDGLFPTSLQPVDPVLLSVKGRIPSGPAVAVVGAREADGYGVAIARTLGTTLARSGVTVVSGGAHGIDAAAQHAALDAGGATVGFLGFGIAHRAATVPADLLDRLLAEGTVISEFLPTARGSKTSYLERNRLIAAFADIVVVVQARAKSGSLNTARHASRYGKPVYAVPGDLGNALSEGTNGLVASGKAELLTHLGALGRVIGRPEMRRAAWPERSRGPEPAPARPVPSIAPVGPGLAAVDRVLGALERGGGALDRVALAGALGVEMTELDELLMELELEGRVTRGPAGRYAIPRA